MGETSDITNKSAGSRSRRGTIRIANVVAVAGAVVLALGSAPLQARLVISEIHYHPHGSPDDEERLEFVELFNDEPLPFDLSDYELHGGVTFAFPPGTAIDGRATLVVAKDPGRLATAHGLAAPPASFLGPFVGRLGNDGDEIVLIDTGGSAVSRVRYNDRSRWPAAADGAGPSLVLRGPLLDPGENESWSWSAACGGTPGIASFETAPSEVVINEVSRTGGGDGWVELFNPSRVAVELSGYQLWLDAAGAARHELPAGTSLEAGAFLVVGEAQAGMALSAEDQALFLVAPGGTRIVDARRLGESAPGITDGRHPDGSSQWYRLAPTLAAANAAPARAAIVISEIHYHPYSEDRSEEFIELTNVGDAPVDLEGFAFTSGIDHVFPRGTTLAPGAYLVLAGDPRKVASQHGLASAHGPWTGTLADAGELLRLRDRLGNPVDEVRYFDEGSWPAFADGRGPSLELTDQRQDNSVGWAWRESDHSASSSWVEIEYTGTQVGGDSELHLYLLGAGEALVDDIEVVPAAGGANHIPNGTFDGENPLAGWVLDGTHVESRLEPGGGPDGSNALRIVASKRGDSGANRIERQTSPSLAARTQYTVRLKARWLAGSDLLMTRSWGHGIARVHSLAVPPLGGTPGRRNSRHVENSGPVIDSVAQVPALPAAGEPVVVRARISDPDGVAEATILARLDGAAELTASPLRDDGIDPDVLAGDGVFAGRIEPMGTRAATAEFFLRARDGAGLERSSPPEAPARTFVYQYDDGIAPGEVPAYRIVMLRADHQMLTSRSPMSNHHLPASLVFGGERIHHLAGLRYRGSPYLRRPQITGARKGFRVRLSREDALLESVRITLDEQEADPTRQVDRLVRHFLQKAGGIPYGDRRHAHLILRGASFGTYEQVLTVDPLYLERSFGDEEDSGELYKIDAHYELNDQGEFPFPAFTSWKATDDKEDLRFTYKKRSRTKEDDSTGLQQLLELMDLQRTTNEDFDGRAPALLDLDLFVKGIAVYRAVEDWDAIGGWTGKNVYLYHHPDGRWRFIPWDHDVSFGSAALQPDQNPRAYLYTPHFPEIRRLLQRPALDRKFNAELLRLLREDYDRAAVDPVLDRTFALLQGASGAATPAGIKSFLSTRRAYILSQIQDPTAFTIETNAGQPFTTSETAVALSGKAPFAVERILEGAEPAAVRWRTREEWELSLDLAPGENLVELLALDAGGTVIGTASIRVTLETPAAFTRGDANRDARVDISDAVAALAHLFTGGELGCLDAADADDSGQLNITDPIYLLRYLFQGGAEPPAPFAAPGADPTADGLECG